MTHPNAAIIEDALKAFQAGSMDDFVGALAEDIVVHVPGNNVLTGVYKGKDDFLTNMVGKVMTLTEGSVSIERHDIVGGDEHVVGIYTWTAARDGKSLSWQHSNIYHIRNGKIAEIWWNPYEQSEVDAFFA